MYDKDWRDKILGSAEVVVLLELITIVEERGWHMQSSKIIIGIDYERAYWKIQRDIRKYSKYVQESRAEIVIIKTILKKIKFKVEIRLMRGYEKGEVN